MTPGLAFGELAPTAGQERARQLAHKLPDAYWGRRLASLLLGSAGGRTQRAFDVVVFETEKARLHPYDNICEKRVYATPQLWDARERALLAAFIRDGAGPFSFVDIGANAGLYALFAASIARAAGRTITIIAVEPAVVMRRRMAFNFAASGVMATILPYAASDASGAVRLEVNEKSRGMSRLVETGGESAIGKTLLAMLDECAIGAVDAMKIDIEGGEFPALSAFFRDAPRALWPAFLILETSHDDPQHSAKALVMRNGYSVRLETKLNTVFTRG